MKVADFDFELPAELIAQEAPPRGTSRLLRLSLDSGAVSDCTVSDLPALLAPGDLLVVNDTRVFPARLMGHRISGDPARRPGDTSTPPRGGAVECMLIERLGVGLWEALMHPGQKLKTGSRVVFDRPDSGGDRAPRLYAEVLERRYFGRRVIRLWSESGEDVDAAIDALGHVPLPPYIKRDDRSDDRERYQTIFARARGSVAAPTAGLHFTEDLVAALGARGVELASITLHVGYGTFKPVRTEAVEEHVVDSERYTIGEPAAAAINRALDAGRRVVAVGTTTTRALESAALAGGGRVRAGAAVADLFIYPGFRFQVVRGLMTNFHLPRSSLLMLVCAFAGREQVLAAYRHAVAGRYRFYSYGDAMLVI